jgi:hypothetical protein
VRNKCQIRTQTRKALGNHAAFLCDSLCRPVMRPQIFS